MICALSLLFDSTGAKVLAWILLLIGVLLLVGKALMPLLTEQATKGRATVKEKFQQWKAKRQAAAQQDRNAPEQVVTKSKPRKQKAVALSASDVEEIRQATPQLAEQQERLLLKHLPSA